MPRKLRNIGQGKTHHCYTRCHGRKNLLLGKYGKKYFIEAVQMCQKKYEFELIAAEIVADHMHLVIKTLDDKASISRIMQYIKARIAEKFNREMKTSGSYWNERFGSTVIEDEENPEEYLLWLLWYIGYNPVRKRLSADPRKNEIGFINAYLDENYKLPIIITLHKYFLKLGDSFHQCVLKFLQWEDKYRKRIAVNF